MEIIGKNKIWSEMYDTDEVQTKVQQVKKHLKNKAFWMLVIPLAIGIIYGVIMQYNDFDGMTWWQGLLMGIIVDIFFLYYIIHKFIHINRKPWEGTVISKKEYVKPKESWLKCFLFGSNYNSEWEKSGNHYDIYVIRCKKTNGRSAKIKFRDDAMLYNYLKKGDLIRYYPIFSTFEKYDKTKETHTFCIACGTENKIMNIKCENCGIKLYSVIEDSDQNKTAKKEVKEVHKWDGEKLTMAKLMTTNFENNEEAGQAYYDNGWDKDDSSWECECGAWCEEKICEICGNIKK